MTKRSRKILTVFGTRPEVIKLFPVIDKLEQNVNFDNIVISTSQHREMIHDLIDLFSIRVDHDLHVMRDNQSLSDICKRTISGLDPLLKQIRPNLVLVQGDTTTAFIAALAAYYNKIPVGHVEAGLRSYDKMHPYPEEVNRRLISQVCDLHFAPTIHNANQLYNEGINTDRVIITGNTVIDSLLKVTSQNRNVLIKHLPQHVLESKRMILVTAHRRENWGRPLEDLCFALKEIAESYSDVLIVYPVHCNPKVRTTVFNLLGQCERVHLLNPLPYEAFVEAMVKSHLIITDSGGIQEEGPSLQKPVLVFRKVTERREALATGGVKLVGLKRENLIDETSRLLNDFYAYRGMIANGNPYGDGFAAERIIQAIESHFGLGDRPPDFVPPSNPMVEAKGVRQET
jgi:UDP-N-acetylglucosamine 2-epimerase (non-hydrolysing)